MSTTDQWPGPNRARHRAGSDGLRAGTNAYVKKVKINQKEPGFQAGPGFRQEIGPGRAMDVERYVQPGPGLDIRAFSP